MINHKTNREVLEELDSYVIGHQQAKKVLINLINRSKIRCQQKWLDFVRKDFLIKPSKCLLIGGSGTGKTYLIQTLAKILNFPLVLIDATQLNPVGAGGGIKSDEIYSLILENAKQYSQLNKGYAATIHAAIDQTILFVDEVDKLADSWEGTAKSWNRHTQSNFLTIFENNNELAGVSFIFAGAFTGLDEMKDKATRALGFTNNKSENIDNNYCVDELILKYGLIPELVGRINSIVELDKFTKKDYFNILVNKLLPEKEKEYFLFNFKDHKLKEKDLLQIASQAEKSGQGVRYLQRELNKYFVDLEFDYEERLCLLGNSNTSTGQEMTPITYLEEN